MDFLQERTIRLTVGFLTAKMEVRVNANLEKGTQ